MNAAIDKMAAQIRDEVPIRAKAKGEEPSEALERLAANVDSLKRFVDGRHTYLRVQDEIKNAPPWNAEALKVK